MKRLNGIRMVLAFALAAVMPLEQAHCLLMPIQSVASKCHSMGGSADHSCCAAKPSPQPHRSGSPSTCPCVQLPSGTLPTATLPASIQSGVDFAIVPVATLSAASVAAAVPVPAPDVGSPPLPMACDAHGLRAPPLSA